MYVNGAAQYDFIKGMLHGADATNSGFNLQQEQHKLDKSGPL